MSADNSEIRFLGDLQRLEIKPGDMFVLSVDEHLSQEATMRLREMAESVLGARVVVLGRGMKLGVVGTGHSIAA